MITGDTELTDLKTSRKKIDTIDREIVELFTQRMSVSEEIAEFKKNRALPVFDPAREEEKLRDIRKLAGNEKDAASSEELFTEIFRISRKRQNDLIGKTHLSKGYRDCIIYRDFDQEEILSLLAPYVEEQDNDVKKHSENCVRAASLLLDMAGKYGFYGNLWHDYLTFLLVNHENVFSKDCEIRGKREGSINEAALWDFEIFRELFRFDISELDRRFGGGIFSLMKDFRPADTDGKVYNSRIRDRIVELGKKLAESGSALEFLEDMAGFYKDYGVGKLGLHKAFRIVHEEGQTAAIEPITRVAHIRLDDLVGYETAKRKLIENTEAFVAGRKANNCLLFGDAGTGKSSSIKAIMNQYYDRGLRIIEVYKHQFQDLNEVISQVKNRNYKFIIFMDDLSFEDFEIEYKYLKAVIEGGLEKKPDNVLIYATSNRRNLIRERSSDKLEIMDPDDLHSSDTVQEKLSLVYRFGVRIYFGKPNKKEFQKIVSVLAERYGVSIPEDELMLKANQWELSHGGMTGRTAQQFIDYLLGTMTEE